MTTFRFGPLAIGIAALLVFTGSAPSQTASPILNMLEVQRLVAGSAPDDHTKLSAHFAALAARYDDEANRHTTMAQSYAGNPNRSSAGGLSIHCKRLAEVNRQSAATLRDLAGYHTALATGAASAAPAGGAGFQGGAGAPDPTDADLKALAAKAATPADHRMLREYFLTAAQRYTSDANAHTAIAQSYRGTRIAHAADYRDRLVASARESAKEAMAAAAMHEQLASVAR